MKRTVLMVILAVVMMVGQANAGTTFNLDLDAAIAGTGTYTNIDRIIFSGSSTVNQSFGGDGIFNDGDTFTEMSLLRTLTYFEAPGAPGDLQAFSLGAYRMYLYGTGLSGSVYNVTGTGPSTWSFLYSFTPGVGSLGLFLDTDTNPLNGTSATLATFTIKAPSGGQGPAGFLGGAGVNGTTDITAIFATVFPGVFETLAGADFGDFDAVLGLLNTHNTVTGLTPTADGFEAQITSNGEMRAVVPEPSTIILLGAGLFGVGIFARKRMK